MKQIYIIFGILLLLLAFCLSKEKFIWMPLLTPPKRICDTYNIKGGNNILGAELDYKPAPNNCPDSSFSYTDDLSRFVPGMKGPGCAQLKTIEYPYCYSAGKGKFKSNYYKFKHTNTFPM